MGRNVYKQPCNLERGKWMGERWWQLWEMDLTRALLQIFTATRREGVSHIRIYQKRQHTRPTRDGRQPKVTAAMSVQAGISTQIFPTLKPSSFIRVFGRKPSGQPLFTHTSAST